MPHVMYTEYLSERSLNDESIDTIKNIDHVLCKKEIDIILQYSLSKNTTIIFFMNLELAGAYPHIKLILRVENRTALLVLDFYRECSIEHKFSEGGPPHIHTPPPPAALHCHPLAYSVQYVFILNLRTVTPVLAAYWRVLYCIVFINILFIKIRFYDLLLDLSNVSLVYTCIDLYIQST